MKKKLMGIAMAFFLFGIGMAVYGETVQLKGFDKLFESLKNGNSVQAVFHYKDCKLMRENKEVEKVPDAIGGMDINSFEYFAPGVVRNKNGYISFSKTVLINHPTYKFVYNYVKVRIYDDNRVEILAQYLSTKKYKIKMNETFYTVINDGLNKGGAFFFLK